MSEKSFIQVTSIQVPERSEWDPYAAQQIVHSLFAQYQPLTLLLRATKSRIAWQVESISDMREIVEQAFYSVYTQASVTTHSKRSADVGFYAYGIEAGAPFFVPLAFASELKPMDPLPALLTPMANLTEGESIVYSLTMRPPGRDYQKLGHKQIMRSATSPMRWLHPIRGLQEALFEAAMGGAQQTARYVSDIQHVAEQKVRQPVKEVDLTVKIRAHTQARADRLFRQLLPALSWYSRPGMNALVPASGKSYQLVLSVPEIAALWHLPSRECRIPGIEWSAHADVPLPVILDRVEEGVRLGTSTFQNRTSVIRLPYGDRNTHVSLIGRTRMGKSTLMHNMIRQDIAAGHGVTVIDPHGDMVENILSQSIPAEREKDVVLFDLDEKQRTIGLNLLATTGRTEISTETALAIAILSKFFNEDVGGGRTGDTLFAAIESLMYQPGSMLLDVPRLFSDSAFRRQVLGRVTDPVALSYWRNEFETSSPGQQRELALPINHRMRNLYREVQLRHLIGAPTCLDFDAILAKSRLLLVNLRGSRTETGHALGALVLSKIQMAAMGRANIPLERRRLHHLYVDEVQNYATSSLDTILSEAAKYGLHLVIANQFLSQLEGKTLKAVLGNVGTNVIFRCSEGDVDVATPIVRPNFDGYDLRNMNRYQAIVKTQVEGETVPAFVVHTDPPPPDDEEGPARAHRIREMSRNRYGTPVEEIDAMIRARYAEPEPTVEEAFDPQNPNYFG